MKLFENIAKFIIILFAGWFIFCPPSYAEQGIKSASDYEIKAAYLFNFIKFITWPAAVESDPNVSFVMCIMGDTPIKDALLSIGDMKVRGKKILVKQCRDIEEAKDAQIVFVSASGKEHMDKLFHLAGRPVLVVGETEGFATEKGIINFFIKNNRVRFEINHDKASKAGLFVSSQLLKIARIVGDSPAAGVR